MLTRANSFHTVFTQSSIYGSTRKSRATRFATSSNRVESTDTCVPHDELMYHSQSRAIRVAEPFPDCRVRDMDGHQSLISEKKLIQNKI